MEHAERAIELKEAVGDDGVCERAALERLRVPKPRGSESIADAIGGGGGAGGGGGVGGGGEGGEQEGEGVGGRQGRGTDAGKESERGGRGGATAR